jgi:hypothetical protein
MTAIREIFAWEAINNARTLGGVLGKAGFEVRLACGLAERGEIQRAALARECMLVIWSAAGEGSHHVWEWVEAALEAAPETLVEATIDGNAPELEGRTEAPIDLSGWNGDAGAEAIAELLRRIKRAGAAAPRPAGKEPNRTAMVAFGAIVAVTFVAAIGARVSDRPTMVASIDPLAAADGPGAVLSDMEPLHDVLTPVGGVPLTPLDTTEAMVPGGSEVVLPEPESAGGALSFRRLSARTIADTNGVTYLLPAPRLAESADFRDPSIMGRLETMASPLIGRD